MKFGPLLVMQILLSKKKKIVSEINVNITINTVIPTLFSICMLGL